MCESEYRLKAKKLEPHPQIRIFVRLLFFIWFPTSTPLLSIRESPICHVCNNYENKLIFPVLHIKIGVSA